MHAKVMPLAPPPGLLNEHHGPPPKGINLGERAVPRVFHNPWPSYRFMTPSDLWLAFQRGAAIAPAQLPSAVPGVNTGVVVAGNQGAGGSGSQSPSGNGKGKDKDKDKDKGTPSPRPGSSQRNGSRSGVKTPSRSGSWNEWLPKVPSRKSSVDSTNGHSHSRRSSVDGSKVSSRKGSGSKTPSRTDSPTKLHQFRNTPESDADAVRATVMSIEKALFKARAKDRHGRGRHNSPKPPPVSAQAIRDACIDSDEGVGADDDEMTFNPYDEDDDWPRLRPSEHEGALGYVRPQLSRILTADDVEDWREPPVLVEDPHWPTTTDSPAVTWIGHASVLVQLPWTHRPLDDDDTPLCGVLFDPIFSHRCSPTQLAGPARTQPPPCTVADLPPIHICCISHDHYDHLDYNTIVDLWKHHRATIRFFVPLGLGSWFWRTGIPPSRVTELDWWNEAIVSLHASSVPPTPAPEASAPSTPTTSTSYPPVAPVYIDPSAALTLKIACTPAQHRSGRSMLDQMATLWGSWVVGVVDPGNEPAALRPGMSDESGFTGFKVYFGGDTGYRYATAPEDDHTAICPAFAEIGQLYGPIDLALLPLATGSSLPFLRSLLNLSLDQYTLTSSQHCSPADSVDIHLHLRARRSLGVHWGTFCDIPESRATRVEFGRARRLRHVGNDWAMPGDKGAFVVADIGETLYIDQQEVV